MTNEQIEVLGKVEVRTELNELGRAIVLTRREHGSTLRISDRDGEHTVLLTRQEAARLRVALELFY